MKINWIGCDSVLAAPLLLDLARLVEYAARRGEKGILPHLALRQLTESIPRTVMIFLPSWAGLRPIRNRLRNYSGSSSQKSGVRMMERFILSKYFRILTTMF